MGKLIRYRLLPFTSLSQATWLLSILIFWVLFLFGANRWHNSQTTKKVRIFKLNNSQNILHYNLHCTAHWLYCMYVLVMLLLLFLQSRCQTRFIWQFVFVTIKHSLSSWNNRCGKQPYFYTVIFRFCWGHCCVWSWNVFDFVRSGIIRNKSITFSMISMFSFPSYAPID